MNTHTHKRQQSLKLAVAIAIHGLLGGTLLTACDARPTAPPAQHAEHSPVLNQPSLASPPTVAVSLTVFQHEAQRRSQPLPEHMLSLGGMNRVRGLMREPDGEVILLGDRDPAWPSLFHVEDLITVLQNAYHVSADYDGVLGVSIDPWPGARDPWAIHQTSVFGMPRTTRMAQRHLLVDYELKKVSASIAFLTSTVTGTYELIRSASPPCNGAAVRQSESTHRFWYCARYPDAAPRFVEDDELVMIVNPIGVQVLTEQEFRDRNGQRTGAAAAVPQAQMFAEQVSQLFTVPQPPPQYGQMLNDFRLIETAALLRFKQVNPERLRYLLYGYQIAEMPVQQFVGGITRSEEGSITCATQIHERPALNGTIVESQAQVQRYQLTYRGGVDGQVEIDASAVRQGPTGVFAALRQKVRASRPSANVWIWEIR